MVKAIIYVAAFVTSSFLPLVLWHTSRHGFSLLQAALALFCAINVAICWWEIALFVHLKLIKTQYEAFRKSLKGAELPSPIFLLKDVSFKEAMSLKYWSLVWSTYSLLDPSYSDSTTFGFCVDVGNGFTTLIPSIIFAVCMTSPVLPARVVGTMGLLKFYQEMYGTFVYFFSFIVNERYKRVSLPGITLVIVSNCIWVWFPLIGLFTSYSLVDRNDYTIFRPSHS